MSPWFDDRFASHPCDGLRRESPSFRRIKCSAASGRAASGERMMPMNGIHGATDTKVGQRPGTGKVETNSPEPRQSAAAAATTIC
jgi:hypothetical protein